MNQGFDKGNTHLSKRDLRDASSRDALSFGDSGQFVLKHWLSRGEMRIQTTFVLTIRTYLDIQRLIDYYQNPVDKQHDLHGDKIGYPTP